MHFESNINHRINKRIKYLFISQKLNANLNQILLSELSEEKNKTKKNFLFDQKLFL
jgi:hypothetical protein